VQPLPDFGLLAWMECLRLGSDIPARLLSMTAVLWRTVVYGVSLPICCEGGLPATRHGALLDLQPGASLPYIPRVLARPLDPGPAWVGGTACLHLCCLLYSVGVFLSGHAPIVAQVPVGTLAYLALALSHGR